MLAMIDVWVRLMRKLVFYILVLLVLTLTEFMIMMISNQIKASTITCCSLFPSLSFLLDKPLVPITQSCMFHSVPRHCVKPVFATQSSTATYI